MIIVAITDRVIFVVYKVIMIFNVLMGWDFFPIPVKT
jgi:hypothetical protein